MPRLREMLLRVIGWWLVGAMALTAQAENVSSLYATGGDYVYTIDMGGGVIDYVHVFSNKADAATFANTSGKALPVRYLAVGGGGAGGTSLRSDGYTGGGGGGGGGVAEAKTVLGAGAGWSINVGKGGISYPKTSSTDAKDAGATAISNGTSEVIMVPAGGRGGTSNKQENPAIYLAQAGAAGGGGSRRLFSSGAASGAAGTFASYTLSERSVMHSGGSQKSPYYTNETANANSGYRCLLPGGGGGAGADGETPTTNKDQPGVTKSAGAGGAGLASDITGETVYYGAGGGAGGLYSPTYLQYVVNSNILAGVGGSGVGGNGGTCQFVNGVVSSVAATAGLNGTGSGGGGGFAQTADVVELNNHRGGLGGDGIVVIRYTGWNVAADTPTFSALGAAGEVTFYACGEVEKDGDQVWLKPGVTASIFAYDAGGNLLSGWEDAETGEFIRGTDVVQVTPATRRNYTAVFGKQWTYDATAKTLTNGDWMFAVKTKSSVDYVYGCSKAPADGILNMATPMYDTDGNAYRPDLLGDGTSEATSFISNSVCEKVRVFLPENVGINQYCFRNGYANATVMGSLSLPRGITVGRAAFMSNDNNSLTNVYFEGGLDGGQQLQVSYGMFRGNSALAQIGPFPRTYQCVGNAEYYDCTSLTTLDVNSVTNLGYSAFHGCEAMQRITFSTNMLVFTEAYESGKVFYKVPIACRLEFPGKAPELLIKGTATVDSVKFPYTGLAGKQMFGAQNGIRLYGSWRKDPEGWNKILNEIGSSDWSGKSPPTLEGNDRCVMGIFRWAKEDDKTEPYYGWLIDTKMPDEPEVSSYDVSGTGEPNVSTVTITNSWIDAYVQQGETITNVPTGGNGYPYWKSYVLGLTPTNPVSKPIIKGVQNADPNNLAFRLGNVTYNAASGVKATYTVRESDTINGACTRESAAFDADKDATVALPGTAVKYYRVHINYSN